MTEEIRGVTWDLDGAELLPWLAAQRLYKAGFEDAKLLTTMWAVIEGESGGYLKAWHHNVKRNDDGSIFRNEAGNMLIKSTDLGFIQKNVVHASPVEVATTGGEAKDFVDTLFKIYPELARGDDSAKIAYQMYKQRGFQPWYAYTNGSYKKHLDQAVLAVGNYLALANGLRPTPFLKHV